jgi:hypothetical protein
VAFLKAAGSGYGIGLSDQGHRVEFLADWRYLAELRPSLGAQDAVHVEVEEWQVLAKAFAWVLQLRAEHPPAPNEIAIEPGQREPRVH